VNKPSEEIGKMDLRIFDVEHGACALLTCDNGTMLMIDCGHNSATGWRPGNHLRQQGINLVEMLFITNYDEDHVSGIANLRDSVDVRWLVRNTSVSSALIRNLKSQDGMGQGIERLVYEIENVFTVDGGGNMPIFSGLEWRVFWNTPDIFDDENNLSMVLYLKCHGAGVMFPGDLEREGWLELLKNPQFREALRDTQVLVAPHHGRESGCCTEVFQYCNPIYVVISDKGYMYDTQKTIPFYRSVARGGPFRNETRRVLTTRKDGSIGFYFGPNVWVPY
jgi:beta-lactamase superfamily II metal-dependent hydrolase